MAISLRRKLGRLAITIFVLGSIIVLFSLSFLIFLWIAPLSNATKQIFILNNWLNNAITILSEALKQALSFQIGLCAAMLSAIALERFAVLLPEIASCLALRNDYSPWNAVLLFWKSAPRKGHVVGIKSRLILLLSFLLVCTGAITQVISILLVSDVGLGQVAGFPQLDTVAYSFEYYDSVNGVSVENGKRNIVFLSSGQDVPTLNQDAKTGTVTSAVSTVSTTHVSVGGIVFFSATKGSDLSETSASSDGLTSAKVIAGSSSTSAASSAAITISASSTQEILSASTEPSDTETADSSEVTAGAQGWSVSPAGFAPLPVNNIDNEAPIVNRKTSWSQEPFEFPAFAEYHEDPPAYDTDGIDDTGMTLRAFLPYNDANSRNTLQSFSGYTAILDSRVACQTPMIGNYSFSKGSGTSMIFNGTVSSTHSTQRLFNATSFYDEALFDLSRAERTLSPVPFSCVLPTTSTAKLHATSIGQASQNSTDWYVALCQLVNGKEQGHGQESGGLVSEFVSMPSLDDAGASDAAQNYSQNTGVAYLLLNISSVQDSYWGKVYGSNNSSNPNSQVLHGQWLDMAYQDGYNTNTQLVVSSTLCYAAFDSANLNITMSSPTNRTEPVPKVLPNNQSSILDFSAIRTQLLGHSQTATTSPLTLAERGLLSLDPRTSWLASTLQEKPPTTSYIRDAANLAGPQGIGFTGNLTLALWDPGNIDSSWINADPTLVYLFQEILHANLSSPAHALQALITVISQLTYYSQLPQFTASAQAETTAFVTANVPLRARGLTAVAVVALVHLTVMVGILWMFLRECKLSMLGCEWGSLLLGTRGEVAELGMLEALDGMRDGEVEEVLGELGRGDVRVGIGRDEIDGRVYLMRKAEAASQAKREASVSSVESDGITRTKSNLARWYQREKRRRRTMSATLNGGANAMRS